MEEIGKVIGVIPKTMRDGVEDLDRVEEVGKKMNGVMEVEEEVDRVEEITAKENTKTKDGNKKMEWRRLEGRWREWREWRRLGRRRQRTMANDPMGL